MTVTTKPTKESAKPKPLRILDLSVRGGAVARGSLGIEWAGYFWGEDIHGDVTKSFFWGANNITIPPGPYAPPPLQGANDPGIGTGFPRDYHSPPLILDRALGLAPSDANPWLRETWLLSDAAKQALEAIDPDAFDFFAVETIIRAKGQHSPGPQMWFADVVRHIQCYVPDVPDEEAYTYYYGGNGKMLKMNTGHFSRSLIGDALIFRLDYYKELTLCTSAVRLALMALKLKGFEYYSKGVAK